MIIAVKFCGGCDPEYDRTDMFNKIKTGVGDKAKWTFSADDFSDCLVVINGCGRACANTADFRHSKKISICSKNYGLQKVLASILEHRGGDKE